MTHVECRSVSAFRRTRPVLKTVSFEVEGGALIGVIGPNGAGKSTLMRVMAGLMPYEGRIRWDGESAGRMSADQRARRIGYMPQDRSVHWAMPCLEVVLLGRLPHRGRFAAPSSQDRTMARAAMTKMDVAGFEQRAFDTLSGGEQARVLIARMLAQAPQVFLADEPVNGLDPAHQLALMQTFQSLARAGHLVFVSLHDLTLAGRWCDRLMLLDDGALVADCEPDVLFATSRISDVYGIETMPIVLEGRKTIVPAGLEGSSAVRSISA